VSVGEVIGVISILAVAYLVAWAPISTARRRRRRRLEEPDFDHIEPLDLDLPDDDPPASRPA
jgi:hypothetical protein